MIWGANATCIFSDIFCSKTYLSIDQCAAEMVCLAHSCGRWQSKRPSTYRSRNGLLSSMCGSADNYSMNVAEISLINSSRECMCLCVCVVYYGWIASELLLCAGKTDASTGLCNKTVYRWIKVRSMHLSPYKYSRCTSIICTGWDIFQFESSAPLSHMNSFDKRNMLIGSNAKYSPQSMHFIRQYSEQCRTDTLVWKWHFPNYSFVLICTRLWVIWNACTQM